MGIDWALLLLYVGGALSISFLCSVLEAAILSVRVTELHSRADNGDKAAAKLLDLKQNRLEDAISAILTLNTIAHTIGAALAGAQAAVVFGDAWVGVFSGVLTVLVLVITEIIPKTLGAVYASRLSGFVGRTLGFMMVALAPLLMVTRALTRLISTEERAPISRGELAALVGMAAQEGTLKGDESKLFDNLLRLDQVRVSDIMTPRTVCMMLPAEMTLGEYLEETGAEAFSRIPLFKDTRDHIIGYVVQRDVLRAVARNADREQPLSEFARETWFVPEHIGLRSALKQFQERREHMAMVADEFGAVTGLITFEDVIETILGAEIIDETDRHVDLREVAMQLRDQRMKRRGTLTDAPKSGPSDEDSAAAGG